MKRLEYSLLYTHIGQASFPPLSIDSMAYQHACHQHMFRDESAFTILFQIPWSIE